MLNVRGPVLDQAFTLAQIGTQRRHIQLGSEARPQQPVAVKLLEPLRVIDIGLATRHAFDVPSIDQHDLESLRFQNLEDRQPVDAGGLHRHRRHLDLLEPAGQRVKICRETSKGAHGFRCAFGIHCNDVELCADINARCAGIDDRHSAAVAAS